MSTRIVLGQLLRPYTSPSPAPPHPNSTNTVQNLRGVKNHLGGKERRPKSQLAGSQGRERGLGVLVLAGKVTLLEDLLDRLCWEKGKGEALCGGVWRRDPNEVKGPTFLASSRWVGSLKVSGATDPLSPSSSRA